MEPYTSGPLFVERNFYLRSAKTETIQEYMQSKKIRRLGVPHIYSFGTCNHRDVHTRFIVMPKYGASIQSMLEKHGNKFHIKTAFTLAIHVVEALEYIHEQGYIHADIKALNLVLGSGDKSSAPVYLIDYGLVARYKYRNGTHKEFVQDHRMANAGTIEFSSRDSHKGVICRRSDLESLGYCLVTWLGGDLPWDEFLTDPERVETAKEDAMLDIQEFLATAFPSHPPPPRELFDYFTYISSLEFASKPDYKYIKKLLQAAIFRSGFLCDLKVTFDSHAMLDRKAFKRIAERENIVPPKKIKRMIDGNRKPCAEYNEITSRVTRNIDKGANTSFEDFNWAQVLAGNPETIIRKHLGKRNAKVRKTQEPVTRPHSCPAMSELDNPTPIMLKLMMKRTAQRKRAESQRKNSRGNDSFVSSTLTYAMEEVIALRNLPTRRILRSSARKHPE
ncbi:hypothetical protein GE061_010346 [Apolygus lucorum]|uniref:non-specific serine/threonine protein kinase n=1 Tax=Apolygus lucorum TaxID=248454 RepID=A0A8S9Y2T8_APOLU|nr:hypothetical protein GE061_010346 [Apolygus lucorum]